MNDDSDVADALRARVHLEWQRRLGEALRDRGWLPPRYESSGGPVPWEAVAVLAVVTLWTDLEPMVGPVLDLLSASNTDIAEAAPASRRTSPPLAVSSPATSPQQLWLSADDAAPLLQTTAHSLRRLAREGRCPVVVRRIGGRWWFARQDLDRFIGVPQRAPTTVVVAPTKATRDGD